MTSLLRIPSFLAVGLTMVAFAACEPKLDTVPAPSAGLVDFSRFVAIGDDYPAGVGNGGLSRARQEYSLSNLLARQFQLAGGGPFSQPLLQAGETTGGLLLTGVSARNQALLGPAAISFTDSATANAGTACAQIRYRFPAWTDAATGTMPNNLGIPGLRLVDLATPGLGDDANLRTLAVPYNAYLERLLPDNDDARSYIDLVKSARPTFCIVSIGLSDLMPFIRSGGTCQPLPLAATLGQSAGRLIDSLLKAAPDTRGLVLGIPLPAFLPLTRTLVSDVNQQLGRPDTASMFVRNAATGIVGRTTSTDVLLASVLGRIGRAETATGGAASAPFGFDATNPLRDEDVLTGSQVTDLTARINGRGGINETLKAKANASGGRLIYLPLGGIFGEMSKPTYVDGISYSGDPVTGGLFGLDGYTLSPRGNGVLANYLIETLNKSKVGEGFGTRLPQIDVSTLPATPLP
ncbi:MAG: hypothetical protein H7330_11770 [Hymenobacteraceae bacterium]|nr:hypothetical protein [Hymenobacteraceae bacterium]